jgi:hypothetical protein
MHANRIDLTLKLGLSNLERGELFAAIRRLVAAVVARNGAHSIDIEIKGRLRELMNASRTNEHGRVALVVAGAGLEPATSGL